MRTSIVIPNYYCKPGYYRSHNDRYSFYDHPTPLNEKGTIETLLDSLNILEIPRGMDLSIVIIPVGNTPDIQDDAEERVRWLIKKYKGFRFEVITDSKIKKMGEYTGKHGFDLRSFASLEGYPMVRNLCILIPFMLKSDVVILIDDDEKFEDPEFLRKAIEFIGKGDKHAIAGYYTMSTTEDEDTFINQKKVSWWRRLFRVWDSYFYMNKTFKKLIASEPRLKPTPIALGGNMVLSRGIIRRIPFDPKIPRGEDIDYLLNAKFMGNDFYFDNELSIKHMPPAYPKREWESIRMNMLRFLIMRDKMRKQGKISANDLMHYPGTFLKWDLLIRIFITNMLLSLQCLLKRNPTGLVKSIENISLAIRYLKNKGYRKRIYRDYLEFQGKWESFMSFVEKNQAVLSNSYKKSS